MKSNKKNVLIVGAGLSGICVSEQLIQRGATVTIVDNGKNYSSLIAAGMINPLVFRRMTKSWRVDEFMPYLTSFYRQLEKSTSSSFFHSIPVRRLFSSEQERDFWLEKQEQSDFEQYMHRVTESDKSYSKAINAFGSGRVKQTYYIDVHSFVGSVLKRIKSLGSILHDEFNFSELKGLKYKGTSYTDVIFTQGYLNTTNPYFDFLPIDQTKGQTLTIQSKSLPEDESLNRKCFILPKGASQFKIGSTYEWNDPTVHITQQGKEEILSNLSYITNEPVEIIAQEAGVRPTTRDRRPTLGSHPEHPNYHIFNGLGAKGYMIAPLLSKEFVDYLYKEYTLPKEVNLERFYKK